MLFIANSGSFIGTRRTCSCDRGEEKNCLARECRARQSGDLVPGALCVPVTDGIALNPALVPSLDLFQDCLNVVPHRFVAFAGVVNFYGSHGHRVGKVGLAR